ncbi:MAG: hypothetical protein AB8A35_08505 [Prochlorococcus sp.]
MVSTSLLPKRVVRAMKLWAGSPIRALENALMKLEEEAFAVATPIALVVASEVQI